MRVCIVVMAAALSNSRLFSRRGKLKERLEEWEHVRVMREAKAKVYSPGGNGCNLKVSSTITASVPREPMYSLFKSYPVTFLTTRSRPGASAINGYHGNAEERAVPYRRRRPAHMVATMPPTVVVASAGGSSASRWPL